MRYSLSPDNHLEDGIMNMANFLRGFEEKGIKNDRPEDQLSKEKKKILFSFCEVCNIQLNSAAQAQVHSNGKSHRKRVKQLSDGQPPPPAQASPSSNSSTGRRQGPGFHVLRGEMVLVWKMKDLEQDLIFTLKLGYHDNMYSFSYR
ncbi:hCG22659, isoform CRA_a [Homo sapiens]|nr:hCG22659, isoform CRA_a [Homo sapiens]EAX11000.1 hCG22659, isoform CRA_a [Homo sapiens]